MALLIRMSFATPSLVLLSKAQTRVGGGAWPIKSERHKTPIEGCQAWQSQNAHRHVVEARHGTGASPLDAARVARSALYEQYHAKACSSLYQQRKRHVAAHPISAGVVPATRFPLPRLQSWHQASQRRFQFPLWGGVSCVLRMRRNSARPSLISGPSV